MSGFSNGLFTPRGVLGAALMGLIGAAGMFLIEQIYNDRRRVVLGKFLQDVVVLQSHKMYIS